MNTASKKISIIVKKNDAEALDAAENARSYLLSKGAAVGDLISEREPTEIRAAAQNCDSVVVFGGDGTILGTARSLLGMDKPILGINYGKVGFLAEADPEDMKTALDKLLAGAYTLQKYTALKWSLIRKGIAEAEGYAVNDVVTARGQAARSVQMKLSINGIFLSRLHCDGIIISAPLGATGYASSAHGPLAFPSLEAVVVTPISPFAGAFPPLVMPGDSVASIEACESRGEIFMTVDGQEVHALKTGDIVRVTGAPEAVPMLVSDPDWYWRRIVQRGFIMPGPGSYTVEKR